MSAMDKILPGYPERREPPCPWCDSREHWSGRVNMCPSRAARMVTQAINTLPEPGEGWQAYALRLHKQLSDEAERVA